MNLLVIDLETTGVDANKNRITQIAARHEKDRKVLAEFNMKIGNDTGTVDLGALRVNRTSLAAIPTLGSDEKTVLTAFVDFLLNIREDRDDPLVVLGHNCAGFDILFIKNALERNGISGLESIIGHSVEDSSSVGRFFRRAGLLDLKKFNLGNLAKALDIKVDDTQTHDAMYDVDLTAKVYYAMIDVIERLKKGNVLNMMTEAANSERPAFKKAE